MFKKTPLRNLSGQKFVCQSPDLGTQLLDETNHFTELAEWFPNLANRFSNWANQFSNWANRFSNWANQFSGL